jgi:hypothetical protein
VEGIDDRPDRRDAAPATPDNDVILVDNDVTIVDIDIHYETSHLLSFIVTCQFGSVADRLRGADHKKAIWEDLRKPLYWGQDRRPITKLSTACAVWRPSRIAQTMRDWPRRMSPREPTPRPSKSPACTGKTKPMASSTRSALSFEGRSDRRDAVDRLCRGAANCDPRYRPRRRAGAIGCSFQIGACLLNH